MPGLAELTLCLLSPNLTQKLPPQMNIRRVNKAYSAECHIAAANPPIFIKMPNDFGGNKIFFQAQRKLLPDAMFPVYGLVFRACYCLQGENAFNESFHYNDMTH